MTQDRHIYVGIDAGGSHSTAFAQTRRSAPVAFEGPPANPNRTGVEQAARNLASLLRSVAAHWPGAALHTVVAGIAGIGREETERHFATLLQAQIPTVSPARLRLVHDAALTLDAAFEGQPGLVVICGTGSIVYARTAQGTMERAGGWGYLLGDEGSGYLLGLAACRAVIAYHDHGIETQLVALLAERFGLATSDDIVQAVYQEAWPVQEAAPLVLEAAVAGDAVAQRILHEQTTALATQVMHLAQRTGMTRAPLALWGGLTKDLCYAQALRSAITSLLPDCQIVPFQHTPVEWALRLAMRDM